MPDSNNTLTKDEARAIVMGYRRITKSAIGKLLTLLACKKDVSDNIMESHRLTRNDPFDVLKHVLNEEDDVVDKTIFASDKAALATLAFIEDAFKLADKVLEENTSIKIGEPTAYKTYVQLDPKKVTPEITAKLRHIVGNVLHEGILNAAENDWEYTATQTGDNYHIVVKGVADEDIDIMVIKDEANNFSLLGELLQAADQAEHTQDNRERGSFSA